MELDKEINRKAFVKEQKLKKQSEEYFKAEEHEIKKKAEDKQIDKKLAEKSVAIKSEEKKKVHDEEMAIRESAASNKTE